MYVWTKPYTVLLVTLCWPFWTVLVPHVLYLMCSPLIDGLFSVFVLQLSEFASFLFSAFVISFCVITTDFQLSLKLAFCCEFACLCVCIWILVLYIGQRPITPHGNSVWSKFARPCHLFALQTVCWGPYFPQNSLLIQLWKRQYIS